ncbi:unnamed protein product [Bursaphelenchus okinawaensis]|uniref:Guanine nucleotide-binding protein-like 3 homolog n=1 Tax=Bursaphelenchus okinawaensis TaxID=465554 RepID=A0A811K888_9BILA|nr:unnamed protein product [Bursaphelenchus okinawaensis]CAG9094826.1 unnamed protein product [Bursaphelenchus okinawaensis]
MGMHSKKRKQKSFKTKVEKILKDRVEKKKNEHGMNNAEFLMEIDQQIGSLNAGEFGDKRKMNGSVNMAVVAKGLQSLDYIPCSMKEVSNDLLLDGGDRSTRTYAAEVKKTISAADIIIEVLDARDPFGSRSKQIEDQALNSGKRLVLLLNKIDLVPKDNVKKWLSVLRKQLPTIAFKASTQEQQNKLGRLVTSNLHTDSSKCIGADLLMKLLKNYCRNKDIKTTIRVGIVGYPNVGKSSIINSLKRQRTCQTGAVPGVTKQLQEIELDKNIRLIDSPGVVLASRNQFDATEVALKNALRVDSLKDPISPVQGVMRRCSVQVLCEHFQITPFTDHEMFLALVARKLGRLKKGGRPDVHAAAKHVLNEWNTGKLKYFTEPPNEVEVKPTVTTELLTTLSKEFDLDALEEDVKVLLDETEQMNETPMVEDTEELKVVVTAEQRKSKDKIEGFEANINIMPKSLKYEGNVRLDSAIKNAVKKNKKKLKRLGKKQDALTDMFTNLGSDQVDVKMET